jgi:RimJ/RimL family protein N-acetyltransferase
MIYGERIRFRHMERSDLPRFVDYLNDPEVNWGLAVYLPLSMAAEEQWFENMLKRPAAEQPLAIEAREVSTESGEETWKLIGNCALLDIDWRNRSAELGILIGDKDYWGKGYGTETMRLLVRHAFETLNLHRVWLRVYETNPRAIRAYEKAGFVMEGRQRKAEIKNGKYIDVLVMSLLREEYEAARQ